MRFVGLILLICLSCQLAMAQSLTPSDSTINGVLRLYIYEEESTFSVEQFVHLPADQIALIGDLQWPEKYQIYTKDFGDVSLFVNADSTELLVASQGHGLMKNQYEAFLIIPVEKDTRPLLLHPECIHTNYTHFMLDCGLGLNSLQSEVLRIKGNHYLPQTNGNWKYSYMSDAYKDELRLLNVSFELNAGGDVSQIFSFDQKKVCYILWSFDI